MRVWSSNDPSTDVSPAPLRPTEKSIHHYHRAPISPPPSHSLLPPTSSTCFSLLIALLSPGVPEIWNKNRVVRRPGTSGTDELGTNGSLLRTSKTSRSHHSHDDLRPANASATEPQVPGPREGEHAASFSLPLSPRLWITRVSRRVHVRMIARENRATRRAVSMFLIATLILLATVALRAASAERNYRKSHIKMQKLCSRSLSDALYIVCRDRGYNGPFPNSDEDETEVDPTGPGLVDECCYHRCTYETLERYCKPLPRDKQVDPREAIIEESFIVKLPYSVSTTKELSMEQRSQTEMDNADDAIKRKVDDLKEERHKGKGDRNVDGVCKGKADAKKRHCGGHCRCRRRRLKCRRAGKISHGNVKPCAV